MDADYAKLADSESPFAQRAAALLERGFSVIPVSPHAKNTVIGAARRTRDAAVVNAWAQSGFFDANIGLCSDEIFTLLESDNVSGLRERVRELTGQEIPRTLELGSGRDNHGCWVFRRTPGCGDACPSQGGLFEFRNHNQYVVGPGSIHPDGLTYQWLDDVPVIDMPDWLARAITKIYANGKQQSDAAGTTPGARVPVGQRHELLRGQGGKLLAAGIDLEALTAHFLHLNENVFEEPKPESVIREQARDMWTRWHTDPHVIVNGHAAERTEKGWIGVGRLLSDVQPRVVEWLWEPYIPLRAITILTGDPGAGKSFIALAIASRLSLLGRSTVYLTVENSPEYTLRPRLDSLGGDPSQIFLLEGVDAGHGEVRGVQLQDIAIIERTIAEHAARFVVVDPIQSYLGAHVDAHRANETRPIMDALVRLAERTEVTLLIVRHGSKNGSGRAIYKGQGSIDLTGAARSELMAGETLDRQKAMVHIKSNVGPFGSAQGYEIASTNPAGTIVAAGYFRWTGECEVCSTDLMQAEKRDTARDEAKDFLRTLLTPGPRLAEECIEEGEQAGISKATLRRVKSDLRVRSSRLTVPGPWHWSLPGDRTPKGEHVEHLANPQHTNPITSIHLVQRAQDAHDSPLEHLVEHVGNLEEDRKTLSSPASKEPRHSSRWETEEEVEP